jgi:hypothetical protein
VPERDRPAAGEIDERSTESHARHRGGQRAEHRCVELTYTLRAPEHRPRRSVVRGVLDAVPLVAGNLSLVGEHLDN